MLIFFFMCKCQNLFILSCFAVSFTICIFFRAALIKMFTPYGKILSEEFLWHTRGPKRGEPRGFAFIQFSTKEVSCMLLLLLY